MRSSQSMKSPGRPAHRARCSPRQSGQRLVQSYQSPSARRQGDFHGRPGAPVLDPLRRLYMFRTSAQDQQWLASQDLLDIKAQQAVDFRTRRTKMLR